MSRKSGQRNRPILVTGSHRSGTTWVGQTLSIAPHTMYIHEPFNICNKRGVSVESFDKWFQYIYKENAHQHKEQLYQIIKGNYPFQRYIKEARTIRSFAHVIRENVFFGFHRARKDTPIVKDPIAIFSAGWLANTFDMKVLVMIRHPAAFCSSLKIRNWQYDFRNFMEQPVLIKHQLANFEDKIYEYATNKKDIISQAILLWNCIYHTVSLYKEKYPNWLFIRHEDLSTEPIHMFESIYEFLELEFTNRVRLHISNNSGIHNPAEQRPGSEFQRNSKANIHNWKTRLTQAEIQQIEEGTREISSLYYKQSEW